MAERSDANDDTPMHKRVVDKVFALAEDVVYGGHRDPADHHGGRPARAGRR